MTKTMNEIIELKDVSFSYDNENLIQNISLKIFEKDFLGIVGPNGGGKTTIIKLILGLLEPDSGKIQIFGKTPKKGRKDIGYLSQFEDIDFDYPATVLQVVMMSTLGSSPFKWFSSKDRKVAEDALRKMKILKLKDRMLSELSGGEKQRVFIARALASNPKVIILDEPTASVDISMKESLYDLLKEINREIAVVVVDHNIELISKYAKEVACINKCSFRSLKYHQIDKEKIKKACDINA